MCVSLTLINQNIVLYFSLEEHFRVFCIVQCPLDLVIINIHLTQYCVLVYMYMCVKMGEISTKIIQFIRLFCIFISHFSPVYYQHYYFIMIYTFISMYFSFCFTVIKTKLIRNDIICTTIILFVLATYLIL